MSPDDESFRQAQKFRSRQIILACLLVGAALTSSTLYLVMLPKFNKVIIAGLILLEWLVMGVVYFAMVSKMRKRP